MQKENLMVDMLSVLSSQEMRDFENDAFSSGRASSRDLMECAGQRVVDEIARHMQTVPEKAAVFLVLCGPGNNGGDGFVIARYLREAGHRVYVVFYGKEERLSADARHYHDGYVNMKGRNFYRLNFPNLTDRDTTLIAEYYAKPETLVVVDALFGIGLDRPLTGLRPVIQAHLERRRAHPFPETICFAVDVPSGLTDEGPVSDEAQSTMVADVTVTFHCMKKAHLAAPDMCGKVVVSDIGL